MSMIVAKSVLFCTGDNVIFLAAFDFDNRICRMLLTIKPQASGTPDTYDFDRLSQTGAVTLTLDHFNTLKGGYSANPTSLVDVTLDYRGSPRTKNVNRLDIGTAASTSFSFPDLAMRSQIPVSHVTSSGFPAAEPADSSQASEDKLGHKKTGTG
jgi:hypothetical protein